MHIGVPLATQAGETRVAATPETITKQLSQGHRATGQLRAGLHATVPARATDASGPAFGATL
ncbi:NAD(P)(+) transhydrogenase (Re/Si-specific) subunit alpha, partial [Pseudomonas syringae]